MGVLWVALISVITIGGLLGVALFVVGLHMRRKRRSDERHAMGHARIAVLEREQEQEMTAAPPRPEIAVAEAVFNNQVSLFSRQ